MPRELTTLDRRSTSRNASFATFFGRGGGRKCVVVVGAAADIPRALQHPVVSEGQFIVSGALGLDYEDGACAEGIDDLIEMVQRDRIDSILVAGPLGEAAMRRVSDMAVVYGCEVLSVMPTEILPEYEPAIVWTGTTPLLRLSRVPPRAWQLAFKRAVDVLVASVALVLVSPLLLVLMAMIRMGSPGSPIFRHKRVGYRGQHFDCLKLRTMRIDAEERLRCDPVMYEEYRRNHFKLPDCRDPRVTRLGSMLRRTSLDELPQLWNVIRGDMSLVGPRPVVMDELVHYGESAGTLLAVRPGLTGNWAVNGRHAVGYPDRCGMELEYVRDWSLARDANILLRTIAAVANHT